MLHVIYEGAPIDLHPEMPARLEELSRKLGSGAQLDNQDLIDAIRSVEADLVTGPIYDVTAGFTPSHIIAAIDRLLPIYSAMLQVAKENLGMLYFEGKNEEREKFARQCEEYESAVISLKRLLAAAQMSA